MSSSDSGAAIFGLIAIVAAGWFIADRYEIRKRSPEKQVAVSAEATKPLQPRPTGMIDLATSKDGMTYRLNADSVRGDRRNRQGWIIADASKVPSVSWRFHHALYLVDCDTTAIRELSSLFYNADGNPRWPAQSNSPADAKPQFFPEGTIGFAPVKGLCMDGFDLR